MACHREPTNLLFHMAKQFLLVFCFLLDRARSETPAAEIFLLHVRPVPVCSSISTAGSYGEKASPYHCNEKAFGLSLLLHISISNITSLT